MRNDWNRIKIASDGGIWRVEAVMAREDRQRGFFVSFDYTSDAASECESFRKKTGRIIKLITVKDILEEQLAQKM